MGHAGSRSKEEHKIIQHDLNNLKANNLCSPNYFVFSCDTGQMFKLDVCFLDSSSQLEDREFSFWAELFL